MEKTKVYLTPQNRQSVADAYAAGESTRLLAARFNVDRKTVANILREHGVPVRGIREASRLRALDETAFDVPSEARDYFVGLLITDGNVYQDKRHDSWKIMLGLGARDRDSVESFKSFLKSDSPIHEKRGGLSMFRSRGKTYSSVRKGAVQFAVTSKPLATALMRFGVVPRKSLKAAFQNGMECSRHAWRGAVDGDGFVSVHRNVHGEVPLIGLCGSEQLVSQFEAYVKRICPKIKATTRACSESSIFSIRIAGIQALHLIRHLYTDYTVAMKRKADTAAKVISNYEQRLVQKLISRVERPLCSATACDREVYSPSLGLCNMHAKRFRRHGSVTAKRRRARAATTSCCFPSCNRVAIGQGFCATHTAQKRLGKLTPLTSC